MLILGLLPHIAFSLDIGALTFFKGAYDEDTYLLFLLSNPLMVERLLSSVAMTGVGVATGWSSDWMLIVADAVFPALAALAAWWFSGAVFRGAAARILFSLALLFGGDILSLANSAVWVGSDFSLAWFRGFFGGYGDVLVPASDISYLQIFRTPEPQVTLAVVLTALSSLVRVVADYEQPIRERSVPIHRYVAVLLGCCLLAGFGYVFVSLPLYLLLAGLALTALVAGRMRLAALAAIAAAIGGTAIVGAAVGSSGGANLVFSSRLPVITPAVLLSGGSSVVLFGWMVRRGRRDMMAWLTLGLLALPAVLANQQVLTGVMVSARDWERYGNYLYLIAGIGLAWRLILSPRVAGRPQWSRWSAIACGVMSLWLMVAVVEAQWVSYQTWAPQNREVVATAEALRRAFSTLGEAPRLLFESPGVAPHVTVRTGGVGTPILDYSMVFRDPIPRMDANGTPPPAPRHRRALFEYWARLGRTPTEAAVILRAEAAQKSGFFSSFLFALVDHWYPATDLRLVRTSAIEAAIPEIVAAYGRFLADWPPEAGDTRPVLLLTGKGRADLDGARLGHLEHIATGRAGDVIVHVYLQHSVASEGVTGETHSSAGDGEAQ